MNPRRSARNIKVSELLANPANIRDHVGDVTELARSVQAKGILNPLIVTEDPMHLGWLLLAGHRRLAASKEAGLVAVPCFIHHDIGEDLVEQTVVMIMENVHRKNLTPVEKAKAYGRLRDTGLTPTQISRRTGVHVSTVHTHLSLLDLDAKSLEAVEEGQVTAGEAIAAVREARQEQRRAKSAPERGRPVIVERPHFTWQHPLARAVALRCDHSARPKLGGVGCGPCWEALIREDATSERGATLPPPRTTRRQSCGVLTGTTRCRSTRPTEPRSYGGRTRWASTTGRRAAAPGSQTATCCGSASASDSRQSSTQAATP